ncbi:hypothetical protein P7C71_g2103, partial [Lecanoromycetidae sp. Uapishka_2]
MLATGLSTEDAQAFIQGVTSGRITIACINSPKSVTLSGDVQAIDELHLKLEDKGVFSRKLKVNVAYHSAHMKAIAEEYAIVLHGLNVKPRNQGVEFYSSVYPGIPVETNTKYWVENLLSPVRFSEAMKVVLESQSEHDLACIEVGPHSALAGPFKQICQSLAVEARTEYFPSVLRKENGLEQILNLACTLFHYGWKIDVASINFPGGQSGLRLLTDLPPYAWNHSTQYWHEGRRARNYLHRLNPSHYLLGTLMEDASDIDMRWTKYMRHSELPWLKDHVIRSEVILPGGAFLLMAMEAADQKASLSGLDVQGYTLRDVTFSTALVVPDTSDGVEVSLLLEPLRQSSISTSTHWDEFRVISFGSDRKAYEHCHGLVSVTYKPSFNFSFEDANTLATMRHDKAMDPELHKQWLAYNALEDRSSPEDPLTISVPLMDSVIQFAILPLGKQAPGALVPTSVTELVVSASAYRDPGRELQSRGSTVELGPRDFEGQVVVAQEREGILEAVIQVNGAKFVSIPRDAQEEDTDTKLCWNVSWRQDPDDLSQEHVATHWPTAELTAQEVYQTIVAERAAWYFVRSAYETLTDTDVENMAPHYQKYYNWLKKRYELGQNGELPIQRTGHAQEWSCTDKVTIEETFHQADAASVHGRMEVRLGRRLLNILRGEVEPLSLMLEDDLLNEYYKGSQIQDRVYEHAARYVKLASHKNPQLRILEIGAGTGSATVWILKALGGYDNDYPQCSSYVFTDISTGFFEKAQTKFKAWGNLVSYRSLNIEEDLEAQGFDSNETYDIIVAAGVLHATHNMNHTMSQVNRLLKPDGKLILVEAMAGHHISGDFIFGLLPGWWMEGRTDGPLLSEGQWTSLLKHTGFSGLDICLRDSSDEELWAMSLMISTKESGDKGIGSFDIQIIYDYPKEREVADVLGKELGKLSSTTPLVSTLSETEAKEQLVVIADHVDGSLLLSLDDRKLEVLKTIFAQASGVLWITWGGVSKGKTATAGAVAGFLRTLRSESGGMNFVTCDIDTVGLSHLEVAQAISKMFVKVFNRSNIEVPVKDFEYAIQNGQMMLPRIVEDKLANKDTMKQPLRRDPEEQSLWQVDSCLCLEMSHVGLLDTFQFVHSTKYASKIHSDEAEIEIRAIGLNYHDLMVATGQLPDLGGYGLECAGIVSGVGEAIHHLKVGDRVCAMMESSFASRVRVPQALVSIMPDSMTFEVGASILSVFTTCYYCLHHAAHLRRKESILIHSAAGGVGQACIKLAQLMGAEIFVTVGSTIKAEFLENTFGLPRSRILNSRTLDFRHEIMRLTKGRGVDVIINSLAGDALRESWRCLAMFGRFIELGKRDAIENGRLDMAPFERSVSYISVGWDHFAKNRPEFVGSIVKEVMDLFTKGSLTPVEQITTYPMSAVEQAFRFMASGNHMGKIVVTADRDSIIKAVPRSPPRFELRADASYLIVGGLSGIGAEIAKWMVHEMGAKSLILISRSGMDATGATDAMKALEKPGVNLTDSIFPNMTLTKFYQTLKPKIHGSKNLHDCFQQSPDQLDFFVMLSSLAGIYGNASQASYAAGSVYQDTLAHHRKSRGLPALTIDVGKVVDVGWVVQNQETVSRNLLSMSKDLRVKDLTTLIEHHVQARDTISGGASPQVAMGIADYPSYDARFLHVGACLAGSSQKKESQDQTRSVESQIAAAGQDSTQLLSVILEAFKQKLGWLLALKVEDVHDEDTIAGHGVDSLVAVEIRNWLRKEVKANVTVFEILNGKESVKVVVEKIVKRMVKDDAKSSN